MNNMSKYVAVVLAVAAMSAAGFWIQAQTTGQSGPIKPEIMEKIRQFKDIQRQKRAEQIIRQFDHSNQLAVRHFNNVSDKLEAVVERVEQRTRVFSSEQKRDMSSVNKAISDSKEAIAKARTAIANQAKNSYDITVPSISNSEAQTPEGQNDLVVDFRRQFQDQREKLKNDIFLLRDGPIKRARTAVQDAIRSLAGGLNK